MSDDEVPMLLCPMLSLFPRALPSLVLFRPLHTSSASNSATPHASVFLPGPPQHELDVSALKGLMWAGQAAQGTRNRPRSMAQVAL